MARLKDETLPLFKSTEIIHMDILSGLFTKSKSKEDIVDRLLKEGSIKSWEAVILLKSIDRISIEKIEVSSGGKIISGDNTDYK